MQSEWRNTEELEVAEELMEMEHLDSEYAQYGDSHEGGGEGSSHGAGSQPSQAQHARHQASGRTSSKQTFWL